MKNSSKFEATIFDKPRQFVHTGNLALDCLISKHYDGSGGVPIGAIVELAGESQTGKTLIAAKIGAEFQKRDGYVYFNDAECTYDNTTESNIGMSHTPIKDGGHFYYDQINVIEEFGEDIAEFCNYVHEELKKPDVPICFILDSLGNMRSRAEAEQGMDYEDMGRRAKQVKELMRQINPVLVKNNATLLIVNHGYQNLNPMGPRFITGGGLSTDYHTTVRVLLLKTKEYPDGKNPEGVIMRAKIVKSKINYSKENQKCEFMVNWETGPLKYTGLLPLLVDEIDELSQAGGWYSYKGHKFRTSDFATNPDNYFDMFHRGEKDEEQKDADIHDDE